MTNLTHLRSALIAIVTVAASASSAHVTTTANSPAGSASDQSGQSAASNAAPADLKQQVLSDPASAKVAETTFYQNCVYCHGAEGSGGKARRLQCRDFDADYLFNTISKGKKRGSLIMPPWEQTFDEKERWQLVAYIKSLAGLPVCKK